MRHIIGGIGDFLQSIDSIQENEEINVFSHAKCTQSFFDDIGVKINFHPFTKVEDLSDHGFYLSQSQQVEREIFQNLAALPDTSLALAHSNAESFFFDEIIGIHPVGSKFSNDFWSALDQPLKILPPWIIKEAIEETKNYFIFGTKEELKPYREEIGSPKNIKYIDYDNIWDSLAHVLKCKKVVAVDSSVKSMAAVKKIKSVVFIGDYEDEFRDSNFINPYVREGVMHPVRFKKIERRHLDFFK